MNRYIEMYSNFAHHRPGRSPQEPCDVRRFSRGERGLEDFGRHSHHGFRGGRGLRPFDHGELRLVILALIGEQPRHGYEIIKAIEDRFAGTYSPSPGVIYPTLTMLEELGNATVEETAGKKRYTITEQGRQELASQQAAVAAALARMAAAAGPEGRRGIAPQLIRAMENLKLALRMRQRSGPLSEEQTLKLVDALDAAARTIERS